MQEFMSTKIIKAHPMIQSIAYKRGLVRKNGDLIGYYVLDINGCESWILGIEDRYISEDDQISSK